MGPRSSGLASRPPVAAAAVGTRVPVLCCQATKGEGSRGGGAAAESSAASPARLALPSPPSAREGPRLTRPATEAAGSPSTQHTAVAAACSGGSASLGTASGEEEGAVAAEAAPPPPPPPSLQSRRLWGPLGRGLARRRADPPERTGGPPLPPPPPSPPAAAARSRMRRLCRRPRPLLCCCCCRRDPGAPALRLRADARGSPDASEPESRSDAEGM